MIKKGVVLILVLGFFWTGCDSLQRKKGWGSSKPPTKKSPVVSTSADDSNGKISTTLTKDIDVQDAVKDKQDMLYSEIMQIQGAVVEQYNALNDIKIDYTKRLEGLRSTTCDFQEEQREELIIVVNKLNTVTTAIDDWQYNFAKPENGSHEEIMTYLEFEKNDLNKVSEMAYSVLKRAARYEKELGRPY